MGIEYISCVRQQGVGTVNEALVAWDGAHAVLDMFQLSHSVLVIHVYREFHGPCLDVRCEGTTEIRLPIHFGKIALRVEALPHPVGKLNDAGEVIFRLTDADAPVEITCGSVVLAVTDGSQNGENIQIMLGSPLKRELLFFRFAHVVSTTGGFEPVKDQAQQMRHFVKAHDVLELENYIRYHSSRAPDEWITEFNKLFRD